MSLSKPMTYKNALMPSEIKNTEAPSKALLPPTQDILVGTLSEILARWGLKNLRDVIEDCNKEMERMAKEGRPNPRLHELATIIRSKAAAALMTSAEFLDWLNQIDELQNVATVLKMAGDAEGWTSDMKKQHHKLVEALKELRAHKLFKNLQKWSEDEAKIMAKYTE
jgi:hypothetical protein